MADIIPSLCFAQLRAMYIVQVMIWDDHQGRCIGELNFRTQVSPHSLLVSTCMRIKRGSLCLPLLRYA